MAWVSDQTPRPRAEGYSKAFRFVEWEANPERKQVATAILDTKKFTPIPGVCFRYLQIL